MSILETRREALFEQMDENSLLVLYSGFAPFATEDEKYAFDVNRNFYYLTNLDIENAILVLRKTNNTKVCTLYIERFDPILAKWVGPRMLSEEASAISGIQTVGYIDEFDDYINSSLSFMKNSKITVYARLDKQNYNQQDSADILFARNLVTKYPHINLENLAPLCASLRLVKSSDEIANMNHAIEVTKGGIEAMMKVCKPGMYEYQLESYFNQYLLMNGCNRFAFKTILASGINATTLHYNTNTCVIPDNSLVLCDLGAAYKKYNADITRTFPANGKFTDRQKEIYQAVLDCNEYIIENCTLGTTLAKLNQLTLEFYNKRCKELGLLENGKTVRDYYWHSIGHHLGLDTHDVSINGNYVLREGCVITVEPGLYIADESIGVRIEDDVLITKDGPVVLSKDIIKQVDEIEAFMAQKD